MAFIMEDGTVTDLLPSRGRGEQVARRHVRIAYGTFVVLCVAVGLTIGRVWLALAP